MGAVRSNRLGLVIRTGPFRGRSARDQLDLALTAATLDYELDLFFIGEGALQLLADHDPHAAGLPRGSKGWASLPGLTRVRTFVNQRDLERLETGGRDLLLDAAATTADEMAPLLAECRQVLVL